MYIDYDFYKNVYKGDKLSEETFDRYAEKAENIISRYTFDRVKEGTINSYPIGVRTRIKKCACELAEFEQVLQMSNNVEEQMISTSGSGKIKTRKAGAVSITYDTSTAAQSYTSIGNITNKYKSILNSYLFPQQENGIYYNLLSWLPCGIYN